LILRLFGPDYAAEGAALLRLLALAALPYGVNALFLALARVRRQIGRVIGIQGAQCVLILSLSYALLPAMGITGVGIAWLAGQGAVAAVLVLARLRAASRILAAQASR
jgi:O-antigen/teichoic acid export membrane protein